LLCDACFPINFSKELTARAACSDLHPGSFMSPGPYVLPGISRSAVQHQHDVGLNKVGKGVGCKKRKPKSHLLCPAGQRNSVCRAALACHTTRVQSF
jgi:hypothetical protein